MKRRFLVVSVLLLAGLFLIGALAQAETPEKRGYLLIYRSGPVHKWPAAPNVPPQKIGSVPLPISEGEGLILGEGGSGILIGPSGNLIALAQHTAVRIVTGRLRFEEGRAWVGARQPLPLESMGLPLQLAAGYAELLRPRFTPNTRVRVYEGGIDLEGAHPIHAAPGEEFFLNSTARTAPPATRKLTPSEDNWKKWVEALWQRLVAKGVLAPADIPAPPPQERAYIGTPNPDNTTRSGSYGPSTSPSAPISLPRSGGY